VAAPSDGVGFPEATRVIGRSYQMMVKQPPAGGAIHGSAVVAPAPVAFASRHSLRLPSIRSCGFLRSPSTTDPYSHPIVEGKRCVISRGAHQVGITGAAPPCLGFSILSQYGDRPAI
jgi:hypothetical protein